MTVPPSEDTPARSTTRRKIIQEVPEVLYDERRDTLIEFLKGSDVEELKGHRYGELKRVNQRCYCIAVLTNNGGCPIRQCKPSTHNASIKITAKGGF